MKTSPTYLIYILKQAFFRSCGKKYDDVKNCGWWIDGMCKHDYKFERELESIIKELENEQ
jgi:hypothetical protein